MATQAEIPSSLARAETPRGINHVVLGLRAGATSFRLRAAQRLTAAPTSVSKTRWAGLVALLLALGGCMSVGANQVNPDGPVGAGGLMPTRPDKDAGLVGIADGFDVKTYRRVSVELFKVAPSEVKDEGDQRFADEMSAFYQSEIVRRLRATGLFETVVTAPEGETRTGAGPVLKLEGAITRLGRGSQAMRAMFGAYGGGRARAQAEMHFVDAQSGRVVMVIADRRIAQTGAFGGSDREHMRESFDDMARDLGKFLVRLARGAAPGR